MATPAYLLAPAQTACNNFPRKGNPGNPFPQEPPPSDRNENETPGGSLLCVSSVAWLSPARQGRSPTHWTVNTHTQALAAEAGSTVLGAPIVLLGGWGSLWRFLDPSGPGADPLLEARSQAAKNAVESR